MKYLKLLAMALFAIYFASCSSGEVTPVSKKINGPLGQFFEVVEREYKISENELRVEFTKIAEGGPTNASWASSTPTFTVELQDEDGNVISSKSTNSVFLESELEMVLALGVGESSSIAFKFDKAEGATKFKVSSKWNIMEESARKIPANNQSGDNPYEWLSERLATENDLAGKSMAELRIMRNTIYAMHGYIFKTADMKAHFGNLSWYQPRKDDVSAELSSIERKNVLVIKNHESNGGVSGNDSHSYSSSSSSVDWDNGDSSIDEFLDEYEKFWRTYINFIKKMDKDNPTAMVEYAKLMKQYQSYNEKLSKIKGNLSVKQLNRINQMNAELMEEMSKMKK